MIKGIHARIYHCPFFLSFPSLSLCFLSTLICVSVVVGSSARAFSRSPGGALEREAVVVVASNCNVLNRSKEGVARHPRIIHSFPFRVELTWLDMTRVSSNRFLLGCSCFPEPFFLGYSCSCLLEPISSGLLLFP